MSDKAMEIDTVNTAKAWINAGRAIAQLPEGFVIGEIIGWDAFSDAVELFGVRRVEGDQVWSDANGVKVIVYVIGIDVNANVAAQWLKYGTM